MPQALREHLVVVLPGIGGSRLADPSDPARLVWEAGLPDVGNLLIHPERLSLDPPSRLGCRDGECSCDKEE